MSFSEGVLVEVLGTVAAGVLGALALLAFWDQVRRRLLEDPNRVPLVEFNHDEQTVRNIGAETAINGHLYHLVIPGLVRREKKGKARVTYVTSLPSLMTGETRSVEVLLGCGVVNKEGFLLQYQNAAGTTFQAVVEADSPRGDAQVLHPPRRIRAIDRRYILDSDPGLARDVSLQRRIESDIGVHQMLIADDD